VFSGFLLAIYALGIQTALLHSFQALNEPARQKEHLLKIKPPEN
jgi:hypothetical protein